MDAAAVEEAFAKFDATLPKSCWWENGALKMIDQLLLPAEFQV